MIEIRFHGRGGQGAVTSVELLALAAIAYDLCHEWWTEAERADIERRLTPRTKALMPVALALGVSPGAAIAAFASVSALFVLPTYPTLLAAVEFDDTGSTRIGKYVFDHPFIIPGVLTIFFAVVLGFLFASFII